MTLSGGRSTKSVVKSVTLSEITLLPSCFNDDIVYEEFDDIKGVMDRLFTSVCTL